MTFVQPQVSSMVTRTVSNHFPETKHKPSWTPHSGQPSPTIARPQQLDYALKTMVELMATGMLAARGIGDVTQETSVFWQHVRLANLATGPTAIADANYRPRNADGGFIGIESGISNAGAAAPFIAGMRGSFYVCSAGILGRYVRQIDTTMDDGNTATGSVQATLENGAARNAAAVATAAVVDGSQYIVCAAY